MSNRDKWSQLSMQQRADLIKLYVESGIANINDIRKHYNSFDNGGYTHPVEVQQGLQNGTIKAIQKEDGTYAYIRQEAPIQEATQSIMEWAPGIGDIYEAAQIKEDLKEGHYASAVLGAGLLFLPGNVRKISDNLGITEGVEKISKLFKKADTTAQPKFKVHPNDQINTITQTPEVLYKEPPIAEVPEHAFRRKTNPLEEIQLSPTSASKQKEKFVKDVQQATEFRRLSSQTQPEKLIEFFGEGPYGDLPYGTKLGIGVENAVYDFGDKVIKIPTVNEQRMVRNADGEAAWEYLFGKESLDEMIEDSYRYLENFNKYWFQEPLSLKGYQKRLRRNGETVYLPVYSQNKAIDSYEQAMRDAVRNEDKKAIDKLIKEKKKIDDLLNSNIFLENDLPLPFDTHDANYAIFPEGIRAIDVHKNGGKLNNFATGGGNLDNKYPLDATTGNGEKYSDIIMQREHDAYNALLRNGYSIEDARRLSPILTAQSLYETGWRLSDRDNNYAGYLDSKGNKLKYNSAEEFWDIHLKNLSNRWSNWDTAQSIEDYYNIVNQTHLNLKSKEDYNRYKKDNPNTFIYSPTWENTNYKRRLLSTSARVQSYLDRLSMNKDFPLNNNTQSFIDKNLFPVEFLYK